MAVKRGTQSVEVMAPIEVCFATIVDYETFPEWQRAVKAVDVIERDEEGRGKLVSFEVDLGVRRLEYRLLYHYEPPVRVWWDFVSGDFARDIDGDFRFERQGDRTRATYSISLRPAVPVPGFVARRLERELMKRSVDDLRREAERRAGG
jgi:coenzyme Q-binding protein COQ10